MSSMTSAEQAFQFQLVENTRKLIQDPKLSKRQKMMAIQNAVKDNSERLEVLVHARNLADSEQQFFFCERWIQLRSRATSYLMATFKWVSRLDEAILKKNPLRPVQRPRVVVPEPETEHPFMEYSS